MNQKQMSLIQSVSCMLLFLFGSSVVMGVSTQTGQDSWIALLVGALIAFPLFFIYARIIRLYPGKTLFEIMDLLLGKVVGKILCVLVSWYAIHLCALVLRDFSEFTVISTMPETPQLPIMILVLFVAIYLAKSGIRTMGKWSLVIIGVVLGIVAFTVVASLPEANYENILPILEHSTSEIIASSVGVASFPYLETVLFLCIADYFSKKESPYKIFFYSQIASTVVFLIIIFRNLVIMGQGLLAIEHFPSFIAARIINIGSIFPKIEGTISMNFVLAGMLKISVCMLAGAKGVCHLFGIEDTRRIIPPVAMLVLAIAAILYQSTMEMFAFLDYYWIYAFPFQVIIPLAVWIAAELSRKKRLRGIPVRSRGGLKAPNRAGSAAE